MASFTVSVGSLKGLHARPAMKIANVAETLNNEVTITHGPKSADADSALRMMLLGAVQGDEVVVSSDDDADAWTIALMVRAELDE